MSIAQNQKSIKSVLSKILPAKFDNRSVSTNASFSYVEIFKKLIGFETMVNETIKFRKSAFSRFGTIEIIDYMINASIQGYQRFLHFDDLRNDSGYAKIKGVSAPSEKVCRDLLLNLPAETVSELRDLNRKLLAKQAKVTGAREVCINIDDTVVTVFGDQEGSAIGYNPRYKGRPSFKEKIGIIGGTNEVLDITLESGSNNIKNGFIDFFNSCVSMLPSDWIVKRVRCDSGVFSEEIFEAWESACVEYVCKAKKYSNVQKIVAYVNENPEVYPWIDIDAMFSVSEISVPLPSWSQSRRFVIIRKKLRQEQPAQIQMDFDEFKYEYQAIVTNIDYMSAAEVYSEYNLRCDVENRIDELKEGFAFSCNSQKNKQCNELFLLIKMIAYNLLNFFKQAVLPDEYKQVEVSTLRRIFLRVAANICGQGRYMHIRYSPDPRLEHIIGIITKGLHSLPAI
jgi:hypothetical protein